MLQLHKQAIVDQAVQNSLVPLEVGAVAGLVASQVFGVLTSH